MTAETENATTSEDSSHWLQEYQDDTELFSFDGYRLFRYRSPTPKHSEHAVTLTTNELLSLLQSQPKPVLLDVQPLQWNSVFIQKKERLHIPGSVWLPNVGMGELAYDWADYFSSHLERLTNSNKHYPIVIYCTADCWMSWNAIKRASEWGYDQLYWYRNGTDAWLENELDTVVAEPQPFQ